MKDQRRALKIQAITCRASHVPTREGIVIESSFMVLDVARDTDSTAKTTSPLDVVAQQPQRCLNEPTMIVRRKEARDPLDRKERMAEGIEGGSRTTRTRAEVARARKGWVWQERGRGMDGSGKGGTGTRERGEDEGKG